VQSLFGNTLYQDGKDEVGTSAKLKDKEYVAIFFGAAWSGSCKQFLPPLVQVYKKLVEEKKKSFEIVYVPATVPGRPPEDDKSFKELMSVMPWLAVPLHRKAVHKKLTRRFQVRQIPMLVLLDSKAKTVHRDITPAITHIVEDADGETFADQFPWTEKRHTNIKEMLGKSFIKGDGSTVGIQELDGKYVGVLFSASWHWQCRRFQQLLEYMYEKVKSDGQPFEIVDMVCLEKKKILLLPPF
jgi:thiol-disulfide isomerase/thioredoxin